MSCVISVGAADRMANSHSPLVQIQSRWVGAESLGGCLFKSWGRNLAPESAAGREPQNLVVKNAPNTREMGTG